MDRVDENKYVSQLKEVFSSCDTTGTGYLDKEELTELCHKLHLNAQLPILLQTLLGSDHFARVNFEEFKEGFVAVLSSTIEFGLSEEESSYLEPVIPEEVKPKFVKGAKRYGRRSRPEFQVAEVESPKFLQEHQINGTWKGQLRRSASLESVESLKSDEEAESAKETLNEIFEAQGQRRTWNGEILDSPRMASSPQSKVTENQVRDIWEELGVGKNGYLNKQDLATVCKNIGLQDLNNEELEELFKTLDQDGDGNVSFKEFQRGLFSHGPLPLPFSSTPLKQKRQWAFDESGRRTASSSLPSSSGGWHIFSSIDDGTGFVHPEKIITLWEEEGVEDSKDILKSLDFCREEQVNVAELTMALDNELIVTKNAVHRATLASYQHELHHLQRQVEQISSEKDKLKQDIEKAEKRNVQLAYEVDDRHSAMEHFNKSKMKDLEQDYRERVAVMRSEVENERQLFLQEMDGQRSKLEADVESLQMEEALLRERLTLSMKENSRLQKEMIEMAEKISASESLVSKLQSDLDYLLKDKIMVPDPHSTELFDQKERFAGIIQEYEVQCRELRDRNDELQTELETVKSQLHETKHRRLLGKMKNLRPMYLRSKEQIQNTNFHTVGKDKKDTGIKLRRSLSAAGTNGIIAVEKDSLPMSIETELVKEQLRECQQEIQDLKIQLETKVNYYERAIELMKKNFEKERKDIEQGFKIEISELEDQKADLEERNAKLQEAIDGLKDQLQKSSQSQELEKRYEKEKAELEQYYAKEISSLGQRLSQEKDELQVELKRRHQNELQLMRKEAEELNQKLSQTEAEYAVNVKSLWQQYQHEKEEILQMHEMEVKQVKEQYNQEKKQWEEKAAELAMEWRKEQLKLEEKMNEEQANVCKTFALEKEMIETSSRKQIDKLNYEIGNLKILLTEAERHSKSGASDVVEVKFKSKLNRQDRLETQIDSGDEQVNQHQQLPDQLFSKEGDVSPSLDRMQQLVAAGIKQKDVKKEIEIGFQSESKNEDNLTEKQRAEIQGQTQQNKQLLTCLMVKEVQLSLLKETGQDALTQLEQKNSLAQNDDAKAEKVMKENEGAIEKQVDFTEEQNRVTLSRQLKAKDEALLLLKLNEDYLLSQLQQRSDWIQVQESKLQLIATEKEELVNENMFFVEEIRHFQEQLQTMQKKEQGLLMHLKTAKNEACRQKAACGHQLKECEETLAKKTKLLEHYMSANRQLLDQLGTKEEELSTLQRKEEELLTRLQQQEEMAAQAVQNARTELEREKKELKDKLLELEDLMCKVEKETGARESDRIELNRLTEDNSMLKDELGRFQQVVNDAEGEVSQHRKQIELLKTEKEITLNEKEELNKQSKKYQDELCQLNARTLELQGTISALEARWQSSQSTIQLLQEELTEVTHQKEEAAAFARELQEATARAEEEQLQQQALWQREKELMVQELESSREKVAALTFEHQSLQQEREGILQEAEESKEKVEQLEMQLEHMNQECQILRQKQTRLKEELEECQDQLLEANSRLTLAQSQHMRELQHMKEQLTGAVSKSQLAQLQSKLSEEQQKVQQLQESLQALADQAKAQLACQQEEHEKLLRRMEERMLEVEMNLKNVRVMLQEKVNQLKEQLEKNAKSDLLLKDLYVENAQLMKALQVTEQKQKNAERKNFILEEKIAALNKLIQKIAPASLTA
ncbi:ninein-like protein isoform X2 [Microcaecilia unicolor]|uniref:Ninein-like protein n=1 Tax=Microcaecilia unicolor TaxID=1415580 RepID=A0A6P7X968_9AMPH|nr:ninein-like protein isoform X2 [Microcaecilia unicolor]